jgi:hypothetical protein
MPVQGVGAAAACPAWPTWVATGAETGVDADADVDVDVDV